MALDLTDLPGESQAPDTKVAAKSDAWVQVEEANPSGFGEPDVVELRDAGDGLVSVRASGGITVAVKGLRRALRMVEEESRP